MVFIGRIVAITALLVAPLVAAQPVATSWTAPDKTLITGMLDSQGHVISAANTDTKGVKRSLTIEPYPNSAVHYFVSGKPALTLSIQSTNGSAVVQVETRARTMQITYTFGLAGGTVGAVVSFPRGGPGSNKSTLKSSDQVLANLNQNFRIYFASYEGLVTRFNPALKNYQTLRNTYVAGTSTGGDTTEVPYAGKLGTVFKYLFTGICLTSAVASAVVAIPTCLLSQFASDQIDASEAATPPSDTGGGGGTSPASSQSPGASGGSKDHDPLNHEDDPQSPKKPSSNN